MRAKPDYQTIVKNVIRDEFAASGYILNKSLVEKLGNVPAWAVREHFQDAVAAIPDRGPIEQAYQEFLDLACTGEVTDGLIAAGSAARLTAGHIANAMGEDPEIIVKRARALGLKLARSEHRYAAASRLTPETAQRLMATGLSKARLLQIAAVPYPTFMQRLLTFRRGTAAIEPVSKPIGLHNLLEDTASALAQSRGDAVSVSINVDSHVSVAPFSANGVANEAINLAARQILLREGRDPDQLVAGVYRCESDGGQTRLECDRIEIIEGRPTPQVAIYRLEAEKIASILALVERAAASMPS